METPALNKPCWVKPFSLFGKYKLIARAISSMYLNLSIEIFGNTFHARVNSFFDQVISSYPIETKVTSGFSYIENSPFHGLPSLFLTNYINCSSILVPIGYASQQKNIKVKEVTDDRQSRRGCEKGEGSLSNIFFIDYKLYIYCRNECTTVGIFRKRRTPYTANP